MRRATGTGPSPRLITESSFSAPELCLFPDNPTGLSMAHYPTEECGSDALINLFTPFM